MHDAARREAFRRICRSYEILWTGPNAAAVDLGAQARLEELYRRVIQADDMRTALAASEPRWILDLGAGRGSRLVQLLADSGCRIVALDCFPAFARLDLRYTGWKVLADAAAAPFRPGCAALVVSAHLTLNSPQFADQEDRRAFVAEIVRLLRPGGVFWGEERRLMPEDFAPFAEVADYYHLAALDVHCFRKSERP
ncbi:MAG TPA: class I SAM-dependent methyltransferase [Acidobacteriota bacterium]|nr:class I SAM-dependent methyltransferase [Acidobacteriota bacterium]HOT02386.1 class I SAM-dependent methyltransferase [Acidobacteriota bacterium]HQF87435.1 class I SAM-dependent methyltransferase [Acidobacteriota bacterium]HQG92009.1 class I SAM-dependent methyltransferase [Acidobacteriota bacterium]HQK87487.1 class I SAM-dependent methyltransferase [Acidobacteriota bacterium]